MHGQTDPRLVRVPWPEEKYMKKREVLQLTWVWNFRQKRNFKLKKIREGQIISHMFLFKFCLYLNFEIFLDFQKSCKGSTESFHISTQLHLMLISCIFMIMVICWINKTKKLTLGNTITKVQTLFKLPKFYTNVEDLIQDTILYLTAMSP